MQNKKGSTLRVIFAVIGTLLFILALYFLGKENIVYTAIFGIAGILTITICLFPFAKFSPK
jgi:hypothetical protein